MLRTRGLTTVMLVGLALPCLWLAAAGAVSNEIREINVVSNADAVRLEIGKTGDVKFDTFYMSDPDRLVVDCVGAKYGVAWSEKMVESPLVHRVRTSQFQVEPLLISRIVIDLKTKVNHTSRDENGMRVIEISRRESGAGDPIGASPAAVGAAKAPAAVKVAPETIVPASMGPALPLKVPANGARQEEKAAVAQAPVRKAPASPSPWIVVSDTAAAPARQAQQQPPQQQKPQQQRQPLPSAPVYPVEKTGMIMPWTESDYMRGMPAAGGGTGMASRRITLDSQGADIRTVLRTISEFSGVNIVPGKDVKGDVTVHIKDAPWEEALDILLRANGYGYREEYGMIRVQELDKLMKEELDIQTAENKKDDLLPLYTRVIFVNNSNAEEIAAALTNVVTTRGRIDVDKGSNALVVNDIEKNLDKIAELVVNLDKKTFQVDINAKLVELDVEASRELGIDWNLLNLHKSGLGATGNVKMNEPLVNRAGAIEFGTVRGWGELGAVLEALEKSNKANIISNPRITTMDNREASILVGKEIPLIVADEAGNPITELTKIGIMLKVIPHVNADRTITLDLHPEVSELQSESTSQGGVIIATSEADTRVVVDNGETAVIGGLIKNLDTTVKEGIPFLKDVPVLGFFFSRSTETNKKQELVIFVTPTIVE